MLNFKLVDNKGVEKELQFKSSKIKGEVSHIAYEDEQLLLKYRAEVYESRTLKLDKKFDKVAEDFKIGDSIFKIEVTEGRIDKNTSEYIR